MAEVVVSLLINRLGDPIIQQIIQNIVFPGKVPEQVGRLRGLFEWMQCFLKDADEKQDDDARIRNWVSKIRVAAYDAEDAIETFVVKIELLKKNKKVLKRLVYFPKKLLSLYQVGKEIEKIQSAMSNIDDDRISFGITNFGQGRSTRFEELQQLRQSSPFTGDKDLVGLKGKTNSVLEQLIGNDHIRRVISIVGMPGVGKTTLAREVYNHTEVSSQFDCCAWAFVSQKYNPKEVLGEIIKQVEKPTLELLQMLKDMQVGDLERMLREILQDKRYLVVLDDIWGKEAWDCLAGAFPDVGNGSRLLFTSRYENVPRQADALSIPYELKTLDENDSWQLFLKRAFGDSINPRCPSDLEATGRKILDKCDGLPLAITVIGSLLRERRKLEIEWRMVLNTISTHWSSGRKDVSAILELSYNDLPPHLKPCFLYFGFFPKNFEIPTRRLFHLWIAEGFIHRQGGESLKDIAADYLDRLIERNLVQAVAVSVDERVKSCRVHDLLRDLAIRKAKQELFLDIKDAQVRDCQPMANCRHLAVYCHTEGFFYSGKSAPHIRSLVFFKLGENSPEIILDFKSFRLLRVLDLEKTDLKSLGEEVGELILLRYLSLRRTQVTKLPKSLQRLQCLETLDITTWGTEVDISSVIWRLGNLHHLYMWKVRCNGPIKIKNLRNLQTLSYIHVDHLTQDNIMKLSSVRKLGVLVDFNSNVDLLCNSIAKLNKLGILYIKSTAANEELPSLVGLRNLPKVIKLKLHGKLRKLPSPDQFPPNLRSLTLVRMCLQEDPLPVLAKLETLSSLKLKVDGYHNEMAISSKGFSQLRFLELQGFVALRQIKVGRDAMPELRCLRLMYCESLELLPEELQRMTSLKKVEITTSREAVDSLLGEQFYKVRHIPAVVIKEMTASDLLKYFDVRAERPLEEAKRNWQILVTRVRLKRRFIKSLKTRS